MVIKKVFTLIYGVIFIITVGCASIVSKSSYQVAINSQPDQADISITDEKGKIIYTGKTPTIVTLDTKAGFFKGKDYAVTFSKEGYAKHTAQIKRGVDGWYIAGNLVFGGLIGWLIVDPATGAMWTLPKEINATLSPNTSSISNRTNLRIVLFDDVPKHLRSNLVKID